MKCEGKHRKNSRFLSLFPEILEQVVPGQCPCTQDLLMVLPQWFGIKNSRIENHPRRRGHLRTKNRDW